MSGRERRPHPDTPGSAAGHAWPVWPLVAVFVAVAMGVTSLGFFYQRHLRREAEADKASELGAVADLKRDQIVSWIAERRGDVQALAEAQGFAPIAVRVLAGSASADDRALVSQRLGLQLEAYQVRGAMLVDADGVVQMAAGTGAEAASSRQLQETVAAAIAGRDTATSELYRTAAEGPVYLDFAAPLHSGGPAAGAVVLRVAADDFLFPLLQRWPLPSASAESLLVRRDGDDVLFLNTLRHDSRPPLTIRIPMSDEALPAAMALARGDGVVRGRDYRGVQVVAALRQVPGTRWAMVAKIDEAEVLAPTRTTAIAVTLVVVLLIAVVALGSGLIWRTSHLRLARRELEAERALAAAQAAVEEQAELFRTVFEASAIGKSLTRPDGGLLRVNVAFAGMLGYTSEEMQRLDFATLTHPDDLAASRECVRCLLAGERDTYHLDKRYLHRDGHEVWASVNTRLVRDGSGAPRFFVTSVEDVTEQREVRERLAESERLLRTVLDQMPVGVWIADRAGTMIFGNREGAEIWGGEHYVSVDHFDEYPGWRHDTGERLAAADWALARAVREGEEVKDELVDIETFDGRRKTIANSAVPLRDGNGEITGAIVVVEDVTEKVAAAREKDELVAALRRSNEDLERFAYVASHDLQEPLRMVVSYMELLERRYGDRLDGDAREFMDFAVGGARRMQRMISDLLAYSRVTTRGQEFARVNLAEVAAEVLRELEVAAAEAGATVDVGPLPAVVGDRSQLAMVLRNLIGNALKFHRDEPPRVQVRANGEDGWCTVAVEDNGIGIAPEHRERAFVVFQRLNNQVRFPGSGIGLSIAKRVVERHGGRIWIVSDVGRGTTVFFTLPLSR